MRIAYDFQIFASEEYGGISRYFYEIAKRISCVRNNEVCIFSPIHINAYLAEAPQGLQVIGHKIPAIRRTGRIFRAINRLFPLASQMKNFQPDLVHETYYSARRLAPKGCKVVLTVFDMIHELFPQCFPSWDMTSNIKRAAVNRADQIICISEHTRKDLVELFDVDPTKTAVIPLGVSLPKILSNQEMRKNGKPYILYVGNRYRDYKNFKTLLCAYATDTALPKEYDLVAFGGGAFTSKEYKFFHRLGIPTDCVRQLAGDDTVLGKIYSQAAVFVYPSHYEGFGLPPLEAMGFDCPVVCSKASSMPEVVGDAAILFDPGSPEGMAAAIVRILNDATLQQSMVLRGRERIKKFSWNDCATKTLAIYQEL